MWLEKWDTFYSPKAIEFLKKNGQLNQRILLEKNSELGGLANYANFANTHLTSDRTGGPPKLAAKNDRKFSWQNVAPWTSNRKFRQNVARFRLYRHRFFQENMRFAAFFQNLPDYLA